MNRRLRMAALAFLVVGVGTACEYPEQSLESDPKVRAAKKEAKAKNPPGEAGLSEECQFYVSQVKRMHKSIVEYEALKGNLTVLIDQTATAILTEDKALQNKASEGLRELSAKTDGALDEMTSAAYAVQNNGGRCEGS